MTGDRAVWAARLLWLWPPALACVLVAPLLVSQGHPLARDLVFVPHQPFTDAVWGLGHGSPRAVPLDAAVSTLTAWVDGGVLARVALPLILALAGWGVARLVQPLGSTAQFAASGFAVWNAYVVERLALGQWALLLGYAALPWLVMAANRYRHGGRAGDAARAVVWAAVASLTPTGGLLALAALVVASPARLRRAAVLVVSGVLLQAPWVVASIVGPAGGLSDPAGVRAFAPDTEAVSGPVVALVGLGGIWDSGAEPATRTTWLAVGAALFVSAVLVLGWSPLRRAWGRQDLRRWAVLAGAPAVVAMVSATPVGRDTLEWLIATVPGSGLLRDSQKFLAPAAILAAAALGAVAARLIARLGAADPQIRLAVLLPVLLSSFVLLPDAMTVTWPTVEPVRYPSAFGDVADILAGEEAPVLVTLPWRSYRAFDWAPHGLTSSDPAVRLLDADVITSDSLQVGDTLVEGESHFAEQVGDALETDEPMEHLAALGVGWALLYPDDPDHHRVDVSGAEKVYDSPEVELYRIPGATKPARPSTRRRVLVLSAHLLWSAGLVGGIAVSLLFVRRRSRLPEIPSKDPSGV